MQPSVTLNGISTEGDHPPDEILHHPGDGDSTELVRGSGVWRVKVWTRGSVVSVREFDDFEAAFAHFARMVAVDTAEVVA